MGEDDEYKGSIVSRVHPLANGDYNEVSTGYTVTTGRIGSSTSPMTSMQLSEVESRLREGMSVVEVGTIEAKHFEEIPITHFKEMKQLAKLAGAELTMHAPLIDPSGFSQGRWGGEEARQNAERQFKTIVERSLIANPDGNMPITIHPAGGDVPANEWIQDKKGKPILNTLYVVNGETGALAPIKREEEFDTETGKMRM
jgi:hypothetical protein